MTQADRGTPWLTLIVGLAVTSWSAWALEPPVRVVGTIAALVALDPQSLASKSPDDATNAQLEVDVLGYWSPNDGGGGKYRWLEPVGRTNHGTAIAGSAGVWERLTDGGPLDVRTFGFKVNDREAATENRKRLDDAVESTRWSIEFPEGTNYVTLDPGRGAVFLNAAQDAARRFWGARIQGRGKKRSFLAGVGTGYLIESRSAYTALGYGQVIQDLSLISAPGDTNSQGGILMNYVTWSSRISDVEFWELRNEGLQLKVTGATRLKGVNHLEIEASPPWMKGGWIRVHGVGPGYDGVFNITGAAGNTIKYSAPAGLPDEASVVVASGLVIETRWGAELNECWNLEVSRCVFEFGPVSRLGLVANNCNQMQFWNIFTHGVLQADHASTNTYDLLLRDGEGNFIHLNQLSSKSHYGLRLEASNGDSLNNAIGPTTVFGNAEGPAVPYSTGRAPGAAADAHVWNVNWHVTGYSAAGSRTDTRNAATNIARHFLDLDYARQHSISGGFFNSRSGGGFSNECVWIRDTCRDVYVEKSRWDHSSTLLWLRDDQPTERVVPAQIVRRQRTTPTLLWSVTNQTHRSPMNFPAAYYGVTNGRATLTLTNPLTIPLKPGAYVWLAHPLPPALQGGRELSEVTPDALSFPVETPALPTTATKAMVVEGIQIPVSRLLRGAEFQAAFPKTVLLKIVTEYNQIGTGQPYLRFGSSDIDLQRAKGAAHEQNNSVESPRRGPSAIAADETWVDELTVPVGVDGRITLFPVVPSDGWNITWHVYQTGQEM